ncbi:unnamed protein product [Polarella glacialis]|uniref:Cytochrome c domain-containing protein n=1 Tax=Polarella glacialis TaxID=89957 RepID=A0A813HDJ5_POLGL|nr:unnamed protein product [Polarella glacialis]
MACRDSQRAVYAPDIQMEGAVYAVKALLAVERIRRLEKKRAHYDRSSKGSAVSLATRRMNPHRSARTLTRTCLAKGSMETAIDVPSVRMGREGQWKRWLRKPSVSPIFNLERVSTANYTIAWFVGMQWMRVESSAECQVKCLFEAPRLYQLGIVAQDCNDYSAELKDQLACKCPVCVSVLCVLCGTTCKLDFRWSLNKTLSACHQPKDKVGPLEFSSIFLVIRDAAEQAWTACELNLVKGEAMVHFQRLKSAWGPMSSSEALTSVSSAPRQIVTQLVDFACKDHQLAGFIPLLDGVSLTDDVVGTMLLECIRQKDFELASRVEKLARDQIISFSDSTYSLLVKACSGNLSRVTALVEDFSASGKEPSTELSIAVLSCCVSSGARGKALADRLCSIARPKQPPLLSAFIRYYAETDQPDRACEMYLEHSASARDGQREGSFLDSRAERSLIGAALRCGRHDLAQKFLQASPTDVAKHITMIRNCALAGDLEGAKSVFHSLKSGGSELNSVVYNTVLDACVECHKLKDAEAWMAQMIEDGFVDVVSFNTLIKAHLQNENFDKARSLMEEMKGRGLQPNRVTFNELVNGLVTRGSPAQRAGIWPIITEMKEAGVTPNQVTCSILLKSLSSRSSEEDILQTMDLITAMEEPMDEVLLSSVVEACVRIGKPELLSSKLKQLQGGQNITVSGSHTFGSLIKAYGHARDIDGVWRCWKEMRSRHIRPTSITLGCMVEAVVSNGDPEGAYELVHEIQQDEHCREVLNSVIYCSVLKGFTREKKLQRVWAVYEEMLSMNVDLSIVTYNTLIDACARCSQMEKVPEIVQDMKSKNIQPNLITYSTMLKGHCQAGDLQTGFTILEQMRRETRLKPDEIMYNSLIDGCAQNGLVDEGLKLLESMQGEGVQPSNFTLSLLVKLMSRARKLDSAFSLVAELSKKFRFKLNVHVYTNLIQACVSNRQLARGLQTFEEMLLERVQPESRTYAVLIRPSLQQGHLEQAAALARAALGIQQSTLPFLAKAQSIAACHNLDFALLSETLQGLMEHNQTKELAVPLMADIRQFAPRVKIDTAVQRRLLSAGMAQDAGLPAESWAEGHRYGKGGSKGSGKGSKGNYKGHQGYGNRA